MKGNCKQERGNNLKGLNDEVLAALLEKFFLDELASVTDMRRTGALVIVTARLFDQPTVLVYNPITDEFVSSGRARRVP